MKGFKHNAVPSSYGQAYKVTVDGVEGIMTLINCEPSDEQALLAEAVNQLIRLRALGTRKQS